MTNKYYRRPCFEDCYPEGVEPCFEGKCPNECSVLKAGGNWKTCKSGGKSPLLKHYHRSGCKTPGEAIRRLRVAAGLSLQAAAAELRIDDVTLGKWERNDLPPLP